MQPTGEPSPRGFKDTRRRPATVVVPLPTAPLRHREVVMTGTIRDLERRAIADLAKVFHEPELARQITTAAGFPPPMLPLFSTPVVFWSQVVEQARHGVLPGGLRPLLDAAVRMYPHNPQFRAHSRALASQRVDPGHGEPPTQSVLSPSTQSRRFRSLVVATALGFVGVQGTLCCTLRCTLNTATIRDAAPSEHRQIQHTTQFSSGPAVLVSCRHRTTDGVGGLPGALVHSAATTTCEFGSRARCPHLCAKSRHKLRSLPTI